MWTTKIKIDKKLIKKILVIQLKPFGDVFLASSTLEPLKKHFPNSEISFLVYHPYQISILNHPYLNQIISTPKGKGMRYLINRINTLKQIRELKFDLVIDQQNGPTSQVISFISGAKYRIGYENGQYAFMYNVKVKKSIDKYSASQKQDLLLPLEIKDEALRFHYHITENSQNYIKEWLTSVNLHDKDFVVFSPGSPVVRKKWKSSHYAKLGDLISEKFGLPIVLLWAKNEYSDCKIIFEEMKYKPLMAPDTDLNQASALLKKTKLLVCNDGGLNHLACATDTTTIAVFGTNMPIFWSPAPFFKSHHHLYKPGFPSLEDNSFGISPEEVLSKISEVFLNE
ncbi:MAG: glycosyltransferase family 9 protein [Candidatus Cloacimonetes bacterium]|nr:glycosyltransferase family 9 protein [Candidatus Cloacimonadota bacterium]